MDTRLFRRRIRYIRTYIHTRINSYRAFVFVFIRLHESPKIVPVDPVEDNSIMSPFVIDVVLPMIAVTILTFLCGTTVGAHRVRLLMHQHQQQQQQQQLQQHQHGGGAPSAVLAPSPPPPAAAVPLVAAPAPPVIPAPPSVVDRAFTIIRAQIPDTRTLLIVVIAFVVLVQSVFMADIKRQRKTRIQMTLVYPFASSLCSSCLCVV